MGLLCGVWALWGGLEWDRSPLEGSAKPWAFTLIFKSLCASSITGISIRWIWETFLKTTPWKKPLCHKLTQGQLIGVDPDNETWMCSWAVVDLGDPTPDSYLDKPRVISGDFYFLLPSRLGNDFL